MTTLTNQTGSTTTAELMSGCLFKKRRESFLRSKKDSILINLTYLYSVKSVYRRM